MDGQDDNIDGPNAYAGKSEQVIRITQPITVATRDNIYKQMGSQRTKANLYRAGYRKTKAALQEQQGIDAAMATTLTAHNTIAPAQTTVALPGCFNRGLPKLQCSPASSCPTTSYATTTTSNPSPKHPCTGNINASNPRTLSSRKCANFTRDSKVRIPAGVTKATYNLRPATLRNAMTSNTPATVTSTCVTAGRG